MDRVLIVHPGALGDFIMSIPAIRALRELGFEVHVFLREPAKSLSGIFPFIGAAYDMDLVSQKALGSFRYVFLLGEAWSGSQVDMWRGISEEVFVGPSIRMARKWKVLEYLEAFSPLGVRLPKSIEVNIPKGRKDLVAIHPGSGSTRKNWSIEGFLGVARHIKNMGHDVLFILGPAEEGIVPLVEGCGLPVVFNRSILKAARILASSRLYIGNDSGISHLSALLSTPTIVIFKATDPFLWRPFGPKVHVVDLRFLE